MGVVQDGQRERDLGEAVHDLADHVGALVPVEQARQHLQLEVGAQLDLVEAVQDDVRHALGVAPLVGVAALQREVVEHLLDDVGQRGLRGVVRPVGGCAARLDVLGADGRAHEDEVVLEVGPVQDLRGDRVEETLGQLGLVVVHQQADEVQLDLVPDLHGLVAGLELFFEPGHGLVHAQVVELDALALRPLLAVPVGGLEAVLGARRFGPEQPVVPVEPVDHRFRDVVGQRGIEALREHGDRTGDGSGGFVQAAGGVSVPSVPSAPACADGEAPAGLLHL
ncbi:hypothetical protein FQZ97_735920 [compost metagenome]